MQKKKKKKKANCYQIIYDIIFESQQFKSNHPAVAWVSRFVNHLQETPEGWNYKGVQPFPLVSDFIKYFHIAPCAHIHKIQKAISQHRRAWVIVEQTSPIIYQILYIPLQQAGPEPRQPINMLLIRDE